YRVTGAPAFVAQKNFSLSGAGSPDGCRLCSRLAAPAANFKHCLPRADAIAVLTANHIDHIRQQWPCKAPISVVPLHVDTRFFQPGPFVSGGPMLTVGDD